MYLTDPKIQALREAGKGTICANLTGYKLTMTFEGKETKIEIEIIESDFEYIMQYPKYPAGDTDYSFWLDGVEALTKSRDWEII